MKTKPVVTTEYKTAHTSFEVDFLFDNNITIIMGDSGTGKSATYSFLREAMTLDPNLVCFNYLDAQKNIREELTKLHGKLIVIDNMDIILDEEARKYISTDGTNQYILMGRDLRNLFATSDNYYELVSEKQGELTIFKLKKYL
ncbi:ABC transporter ATP-binding protein [Pseudobutyrivibrio sp.]|uniref:ABC transporter ATP-binding protein n=1 Tax=Pseudobutyrivibrio sp. TaxID=2014367 RepID=UPI0025FDE05D|nr:ABC transporter ATP-binding protein [Pseudobutyrivibrio sp.]